MQPSEAYECEYTLHFTSTKLRRCQFLFKWIDLDVCVPIAIAVAAAAILPDTKMAKQLVLKAISPIDLLWPLNRPDRKMGSTSDKRKEIQKIGFRSIVADDMTRDWRWKDRPEDVGNIIT
uniref:Uncharacterized protein n=1 Tax=Glossina palpalis gambiensis TaxID=67801 RepID=A0A1B0BIL7_9MUSC